MDRDLPEARCVIYTTVDVRGYEICPTIRTDSNTPDTVADTIDRFVTALEKKGWKPIIRSKGGFPKKEQKFTGKKCPQCGADTIEATMKNGNIFEKCSTSKWNPMTRQAEGCTYANFGYKPASA